MTQVSDDKDGDVLDRVWLIKDDTFPAYNIDHLENKL